jgi:hypothetical protein
MTSDILAFAPEWADGLRAFLWTLYAFFTGASVTVNSTGAMDVVTQFHSCALNPEELNQVLADYVALERVRVFRRLLLRRCGALSLAVLLVGATLHWISPVATAASIALFLIPPVWACVAEFQIDRALGRRLDAIPGVMHSSERGDDTLPDACGRYANGKS